MSSQQIADIVLFFSKFSQESAPCVQIVIQNKLPIKLIPLDTPAAREAALNGKTIQIRSVPSLLVEYLDGNVQLFVGRPKIVAWLEYTFNRQSHQPPPPPDGRIKSTTLIENNDSPSDEDSPSEEEPPHRKPSKHRQKEHSKKGKSLPVQKKKVHSKKKRPKSVETPVELIMEDGQRPDRPPPPPTKGLLVGTSAKTKSSNAGLLSAAQQMMADRDKTLGYKADA